VESVLVAEYFEKVVNNNMKISKLATNYILTDYLGLLKKECRDLSSISADNFSKLMSMIYEGKLSSRGAKDTLSFMIKEDGDPEIIAQKNDLIQKNDEGEIKKIVEEIVLKNTEVVSEYKKGKEVALQFLVGQGMKITKGSANPELLKKLLIEIINSK
jgi:aspartyl-tRNA(Asn)/glutamyl-tRNA(Gln) amidotransferase subunit B